MRIDCQRSRSDMLSCFFVVADDPDLIFIHLFWFFFLFITSQLNVALYFVFGVLISNNCKISKRFFQISVLSSHHTSNHTNRSIGRFAVCIYRVYRFRFFFWVFSFFWGSSRRRTAGKQQLNRLNARCRLNSVSNFEVSLGCPQRTTGRRRRRCRRCCCLNVASVGVGSAATSTLASMLPTAAAAATAAA